MPWVTKTILRSINRKNKPFYKYKSNPTQQTKQKYTKYRNTLTSVLRCAKKDHYCKQFDLNKGDMKNTWRVINNILNNKSAE